MKSAVTETASTFEAIRFAELRRELHARALFLAQNDSMADDLVQSTLERGLVAYRTSFRPGSNLRAWLMAIMRNIYLDERRHEAIRRRYDREAPVQDDMPLGPIDVILSGDIDDAVATLKTRDRHIFSLAYVERRSYCEIAGLLKTNINTVGGRLHRIRAKLRRRLAELCRQRLPEIQVVD